MSIISEIQEMLISKETTLSLALLKLHLLSSNLRVGSLEKWIKLESEGYPQNIGVPDYRKTSLIFKGCFVGIGGAQMNNMPIPISSIEQILKKSVEYSIRNSISGIESYLADSNQKMFAVDVSNYIPIIRNKIFKDLSCISLDAIFPSSVFSEIYNTVKHRMLEFLITLEHSIPASKNIKISQENKIDISEKEKNQVTQIFCNAFYNNTNTTIISNNNDNLQVTTNIVQNNKDTLIKYLTDNKFPEQEALEPVQVIGFLPGPYDIKNFHGNVKCVVTSKSPTGPYRGVGRPAAVFVLERLVDMAAKLISMDPIEIRLKNLINNQDLPYRIGSGIIWNDAGFKECLIKATNSAFFQKMIGI